ncbi:AMP-binding protein [Micromonospora peucetia]|uniref:AMP-binding protein n=1 Tax=Micromonospora peucetia TaxID=47871 RepID=UPI00398D37A6
MSDVLTTIPALLRQAAQDAAELEALVDGDVRMTFAELDAAVTRFARAAVAHGLEPGDRVVVWAPNSADWVISALGVLAAGGVLCPVNTRFRGGEARYAIAKVRATMVILDDTFLSADYLAALRGDGPPPAIGHPVPLLPSVRTVVDLSAAAGREQAGDGVWSLAGFTALADQVDPAIIDGRIAALDSEGMADILFTSGTTGYPKGAMVSHASNLRVDLEWARLVGLQRGDRYLMVNPFFHSFGYRAGILACLLMRATIIPVAVFDVETVLRLVERERVTVFPGAPTVYTSLLEHPAFGAYDVSSVRLAVTGATVVPVPLLHRMREELGFRDVITAYGLTETCGTATVCPPDADLERISTSCGKAIPGTELRIAGLDGQALPAGESGEVLVRGYNVMLGYFEDPVATVQAIDEDGWLHTGDVGWVDEDGYLRITDRIKDVYMVGGFNVYPAEVERVLCEHPAVSDVAVVGVPDARMGEVGSAFVQIVPDWSGDESVLVNELEAWCRDRLANFKRPRSFSIVPALPRTPSGKIQKFKLTG